MLMDNKSEHPQTWYTNKEIFEMVQELRKEMTETRRVISEYNKLREDLTWAIDALNKLHAGANARWSMGVAMREWGGWIVALAILLLKLWD